MEDRWFYVGEIEVSLGIKRGTVYRWISERKLPGHKIGRLWKFRKEEIDEWMKQGGAAELYHRLLLVVAPGGADKTTALCYVRDRNGVHLVNINLELSRQMLGLTERQRALQLPRLLQDILVAELEEHRADMSVSYIFPSADQVSITSDPLKR